MAIFGPKPLEKCQLFDFFNLLFLQHRKAFFRSRLSQNTFSWSIVGQKKYEKLAFLDQNHGLTPLEKCQFFRRFELVVFIAYKGVFSFQNIKEYIFLVYSWSKKKIGKMAIFGPKPLVNPLAKMSIFPLFGLLAFIAQKGVFSFQNIIKDIFLAHIA